MGSAVAVRCEIQEVAPCPVVDLDEPEIWVEAQFARHALFHVERHHALQDRREQALAALLEKDLRRRAEEARRAVEAIELHENRTGLGSAALAQSRIETLDRAPAQIGGDPEIGAQARHYWTAMPEAVESSRIVRALNSPVTGRRRSCSKRSTACRVPEPIMPSTFTL